MQFVSKFIKRQDISSDDNDKDMNSKKGISIINLLTPKASVAFLSDHCTLRQGLEKMRVHRYTAIPVVSEDGRYIGTVSEGDFLWYMLDNSTYSMKLQEDFLISDILRYGWNPAVKIDTTIDSPSYYGTKLCSGN